MEAALTATRHGICGIRSAGCFEYGRFNAADKEGGPVGAAEFREETSGPNPKLVRGFRINSQDHEPKRVSGELRSANRSCPNAPRPAVWRKRCSARIRCCSEATVRQELARLKLRGFQDAGQSIEHSIRQPRLRSGKESPGDIKILVDDHLRWRSIRHRQFSRGGTHQRPQHGVDP